ncbi:MAG: hypothetical protein KF894_07560 [Labilithrix sp.]|nr:hypothetical protein [Labilithrix sp.]
MTIHSTHRRLGALLLSALVQCVVGCGDDPEQRAPRDETARAAADDAGAEANADASRTITVQGRLLDMASAPLAGIPVFVGDRPLALTNASGEFSATNVSTPYTLTALVSASKTVVIYEGLSRPDPTIIAADRLALRKAGIQGTLAGGAGYPEAALTRTSVQLAAAPVQEAMAGLSDLGANTFIVPPDGTTWSGPKTIQGTLHALQYTHAAASDLKPIDYAGYGALANVSISDGENHVPLPVTLAPIGKVSFSASATIPPAYAVTAKVLQLTVGGQTILRLPNDTQPGPAVAYPLPAIADARVRLTVTAENADTGAASSTTRSGLALDAANVALGILPSPTLVLPVDAATGVSERTSFSWTKSDQGIHMLFASAGPGHPQYQIVTSSTEALLPDLSEAGIQLPPATTYHWIVTAYAPFDSVDRYAGDDVGARNSVPVLYDARSAVRSFTTSP